jgi:hypothetical protein
MTSYTPCSPNWVSRVLMSSACAIVVGDRWWDGEGARPVELLGRGQLVSNGRRTVAVAERRLLLAVSASTQMPNHR